MSFTDYLFKTAKQREEEQKELEERRRRKAEDPECYDPTEKEKLELERQVEEERWKVCFRFISLSHFIVVFVVYLSAQVL